jgi:hypothetical protein
MEQAAVARHPAAGGANRLDNLARHLAGDLPQLSLQPQVPGRAGRVDGDRPELLPDRKLGEQALRPGDGIEDVELAVPLPVLVREVVRDLAGETEGAGARVDDDGSFPFSLQRPRASMVR